MQLLSEKIAQCKQAREILDKQQAELESKMLEMQKTIESKKVELEELEDGERTTPASAASSQNDEEKKVFDDGSIYKGELNWAEEMHGIGTFEENTGFIYHGDFLENERHGEGILYYPSGVICYKGQWKADDEHGEGKKYDDDGHLVYSGTFVEGKYEGVGTEYGKGWKYAGQFKGGLKHGFGLEFFLTGGLLKFEGNYLYGKRHGYGMERFPNGKVRFSGFFSEGFRHGYGCDYSNSGRIVFEGEYFEGRKLAKRKATDAEESCAKRFKTCK
jgi:antitoxin component YwqK of YwqJK toxin-antitoxin module